MSLGILHCSTGLYRDTVECRDLSPAASVPYMGMENVISILSRYNMAPKVNNPCVCIKTLGSHLLILGTPKFRDKFQFGGGEHHRIKVYDTLELPWGTCQLLE